MNVPYCSIEPREDLFIMGPLVSKDRNVGGGAGVGARHDDGSVFDRAVGVLGQPQRRMGPTIANKVAFGGGCFWGVDHYITTRKLPIVSSHNSKGDKGSRRETG